MTSVQIIDYTQAEPSMAMALMSGAPKEFNIKTDPIPRQDRAYEQAEQMRKLQKPTPTPEVTISEPELFELPGTF